MVNEVLSFQIGQCGNSIGLQFWQNMSKEHGIDCEGRLVNADLQEMDNKESFFHEYESGKYVPRSLMLDLEPRVIQSIKNSEYSRLFEHQNMFVGEDGGGAGNNWASGYERAQKYKETIMELIRKEYETMDSPGGFLLTHSISGGTGAGLGSYILEQLADYCPKQVVQTYSIFPALARRLASGKNDEVTDIKGLYTDVVIEPYNSLLTLMRLTGYADSVVVLDNHALHNLSPDKIFPRLSSFVNINKIVSNVMTASLAPLRYSSVMYNCLNDILLSLTPLPKLHFLMSGYTPLRSDAPIDPKAPVHQIMKTSVESVLRRLGKMRNMMVSLQQPLISSRRHISVFNVIQGNNLSEKSAVARNMRSQFIQRERYLPWLEPMYQTVFCPWSRHLTRPNRISGLTLTNHSAIINFFQSILSQFGKLYSRMAYIDQMQSHSGFDSLREELESCKYSCENLISEYKSA